MDTALVRPQVPTYSAITPETRAPERVTPAANTDLPVEKTVSPTDQGNESRRASDNPRTQEPLSGRLNIERQNFIDPESESLIYQAKNSDTGEVVQQIPSESLRRVRAYTRSIAEQAAPPASQRAATTA
ncbi:hypothetical protein [Roseibium limicola]|nr:hypothetical protein [Roseibium limicola]